MKKLYLTLIASIAVVMSAATYSAELNVEWTNTLNAAVNGNTLQRTGGCDGCRVSGAISAQEIRDGNGHLTFTATDSGSLYYVGLSHGEEFNSTADIDFAFRLQEGSAEIRENDTYRADTPYAANDVFKIVVEDSQVRYYKNNSLVYSSESTASFPLVALAGLVGEGAHVVDAKIGSPGLRRDVASNAPAGGDPAWTNHANVAITGSRIEKTGGCDGCQDAGAVSTQTINARGGYVEFVVNDENKVLFAGLSNGDSNTAGEDIDFALRFQEGMVEVRENGSYKTDTQFRAGDRFRVAVNNGVVQYYKNGESFYQSATRPAFPLVFDTALLGSGALITDVTINTGPYRGA